MYSGCDVSLGRVFLVWLSCHSRLVVLSFSFGRHVFLVGSSCLSRLVIVSFPLGRFPGFVFVSFDVSFGLSFLV